MYPNSPILSVQLLSSPEDPGWSCLTEDLWLTRQQITFTQYSTNNIPTDEPPALLPLSRTTVFVSIPLHISIQHTHTQKKCASLGAKKALRTQHLLCVLWPTDPIKDEDPRIPETALTQKKKSPYRENLTLHPR